MTETQLKLKVLRMVKNNYPAIFLQKLSDKFTSGLPDFIGCLNGKFFAIELKVGKNKPTPLQTHFLDKIEKAGGTAQVCWSAGEVMSFLETIGR